MKHFVVYHNPAPHAMGKPVQRGGPFLIRTRKPVERTLGHRIWVLSAEGAPRTFFLVATFIVDGTEHRPGDRFPNVALGQEGRWFDPTHTLNGLPWLSDLKKTTGNFAFGLTEIKQAAVIAGLKGL